MVLFLSVDGRIEVQSLSWGHTLIKFWNQYSSSDFFDSILLQQADGFPYCFKVWLSLTIIGWGIYYLPGRYLNAKVSFVPDFSQPHDYYNLPALYLLFWISSPCSIVFYNNYLFYNVIHTLLIYYEYGLLSAFNSIIGWISPPKR